MKTISRRDDKDVKVLVSVFILYISAIIPNGAEIMLFFFLVSTIHREKPINDFFEMDLFA